METEQNEPNEAAKEQDEVVAAIEREGIIDVEALEGLEFFSMLQGKPFISVSILVELSAHHLIRLRAICKDAKKLVMFSLRSILDKLAFMEASMKMDFRFCKIKMVRRERGMPLSLVCACLVFYLLPRVVCDELLHA